MHYRMLQKEEKASREISFENKISLRE